MPEVSIVVPVFNGAATIARTLESLRRQTYTNWELIVVDDGSNDDTVDRVARVRDTRIRLITTSRGGRSRARNRGLAQASGRFVAFCDADDLWTPDKLGRQVEALRLHPDAGAAYIWTAFIDERDRFLFAKNGSLLQGDVYADLLATFFLASGSNVLARRRCLEVVGGFDERLTSVEDWELWLRVARCWPFVVVRRHQTLYRLTVGSASGAVEQYQACGARVALDAFEGAPPRIRRRRGECLANLRQHGCVLYLTRTTDRGAKRLAARLLLLSVRAHPQVLFEPRTLALALACAFSLPVPRRTVPSVTRSLLRLYGAWMALGNPELRELRRGLARFEDRPSPEPAERAPAWRAGDGAPT
jgi:hypothetical protein